LLRNPTVEMTKAQISSTIGISMAKKASNESGRHINSL